MIFERVFRRTRLDREQQEEIDSYLAIEASENVARGMNEADAMAAARRKLGNATRIREDVFHMNGILWLDTLVRNVRHSLRSLRREPGFAITALLTLALGIGANCAVFSVVHSVLLRPLRYPHPEELVALRQMAPGAAGLASFSDGLPLSSSMYFTYADHNRTFSSVGIWAPSTANVTGVAEPEQVRVAAVSHGVLESFAVQPLLGRAFSAADQLPGSTPTVLLSYGYWRKRFGENRSVVGKTLQVDSIPRFIAGVMPPGFKIVDSDFDLLVPLALDRSKQILAGFGFQGIGRLKPGVTIAQANDDLARLLPVWMASWTNGPGTDPYFYKTWRITPALRSLQLEVTGGIREVLWVVLGTLGIVLLIACANVANLLLIRVEARQQELAVRTALGAAHARVIGELLTDSVVLGVLGGTLGIALAWAGLHLLVAAAPANLPRLDEISIDFPSLAFTAAVSAGCGLLFGAVAGWRWTGKQPAGVIRGSMRTSTAGRERHRLRNLLAITQVALAFLLLTGAGLMIRTFAALRQVQPGFSDAAHLETMRISIPGSLIATPEVVTRTQQSIVQRLSSLPGVTSAAFGSDMAMEGYGSMWDEVQVRDVPHPSTAPPMRYFKYVSPGFFKTAGTRLVAGRDISWSDVFDRHPVVLVSENFARELWGSAHSAVGKQLRQFPGMPWHEVIGVAEDVRENGVSEKAPAIVYWSPLRPDLFGKGPLAAVRTVTVILRTQRAGTEALLHEMRDAVWSVNRSLPIASVRTMQQIYSQSLARISFTLVMLGIAGGMALILGLIGIYGVISYAVSQRRREIGIRLALGAQGRELTNFFLRSGLGLAVAGCSLGLLSALVTTRVLHSLLFGVSATDPLTYVLVPLLLSAAVALATYLPARRAAAVDPAETLRSV